MRKTTPFFAGLIVTVLAACNLTNNPADLPTPEPIIITATPENTPIVTVETPVPTNSPAPSETSTATLSPTSDATATNTQPPTVTPTPSLTPQPTVGFRFDNLNQVDLPDSMLGGVTKPMLIFTNSNNQATITSLATARPENETLTVFAVDPDFPQSRVTLLELNAATGNRIFPSADGTALAYFRDGTSGPGLYIVNMADGYFGRVAAVNTLVQRGIYAPPQWSSDGEQLAVTLSTAYDLDIFQYARDGSKRENLTNHGSYDFFPAWSPNGEQLAFVSDRATCPSWIPGEADACAPLTTPPSTGGQVYVMDLATREVTKISDEYVTEPPYWINSSLLVIPAGDGQDLLKPERRLWLANVPGKTVREVSLTGDDSGLYLSDVWSPDGTQVLFQHVTTSGASVVMMTADGDVIMERTSDMTFPRYGMRAAWSPLDRAIAIGGAGGECPYGTRVVDTAFEYVSRGSPPPTMCSPMFSPDGRFIAFVGVSSITDSRNPDGRLDVYVSDSNGFGVRNISGVGTLRGSMTLIGWLGGDS